MFVPCQKCSPKVCDKCAYAEMMDRNKELSSEVKRLNKTLADIQRSIAGLSDVSDIVNDMVRA